MPILKVDKDTVVNMWDLPYGMNEDTDVEVLEDTQIGTTRWSIRHKLIVRIKDKFYSTIYATGATECQDEQPWQYEKEVTFTEVHQVEKLVKVWEPVDE
jgi:hypothetical protein